MDNKKAIRFATDVGPGESVTLDRVVEEPATIESLDIRFYQGPELAVQVQPRRIPDNGGGQPQPLVDLVGKDWIDGDGDHWEFDISESVEQDDVLEVEIDNTAQPDPDVNLTFDVAVNMTLDREGGALRPIRSVVDTIGGWL
jgi:hypothetical protein